MRKYRLIAWLMVLVVLVGMAVVPLATESVYAEIVDEATATDTPAPVVTDTPAPVVTDTPTPVVTDTPTPVVTGTPTPVVTDTPTPVVTTAPTPVDTFAPIVTDTIIPAEPSTPAPTTTAAPTSTAAGTSSPTAAATATNSPQGTAVPWNKMQLKMLPQLDKKTVNVGETVRFSLTARLAVDGTDMAVSNAKGNGKLAYSQAICQYVNHIWIQFDASYTKLFEADQAPMVALIAPLSDTNYAAAGLSRVTSGATLIGYADGNGTVYAPGTPFNVGVGSSGEMTVRSTLASGTYSLKGTLYWDFIGDSEGEKSAAVNLLLNVVAPEATAAPTATETAPITSAPTATETAPITSAPTAAETAPVTSAPTAAETAPVTSAPTAITTPVPTNTPTPEPTVTNQPNVTPAANALAMKISPETLGAVHPGETVKFKVYAVYGDTLSTYAGSISGGYDQAITSFVPYLYAELDNASYDTVGADSITSMLPIVAAVNPITYKQLGLEEGKNEYRDPASNIWYDAGTSFNAGYVEYTIAVREDVASGVYPLRVYLHWRDALGTEHREDGVVNLTVAPTPTAEPTEKPSYYGGGGGGGSSGSVSTPDPAAKMIIEKITTSPQTPKVGDTFNMTITLRNTSTTQKIRNIDMTLTADNNAVMPVSGLTKTHMEDMGKGEVRTITVPMRVSSEATGDVAHIAASFEFEDESAAAQTDSQDLFIALEQQLRVSLDEPFSEDGIVYEGDTYTIKMAITNKGKSTVNNVSARIVSGDDNLTVGSSWYGGNMETGTQKQAEMEVIPGLSGSYDVSVEVSYEDANGNVSTQTKPMTFTVNALDTEDYDDYSEPDFVEPSPEPGLMENAGKLPFWVYGSIGGVLLAVCVALGLGARSRRRKALEDDEMD